MEVANLDSVVAHLTRGGRERRDSIKLAVRCSAAKQGSPEAPREKFSRSALGKHIGVGFELGFKRPSLRLSNIQLHVKQ